MTERSYSAKGNASQEVFMLYNTEENTVAITIAIPLCFRETVIVPASDELKRVFEDIPDGHLLRVGDLKQPKPLETKDGNQDH